MRKPIDTQLKIGEVDPSQITFDLRSRDETTKILMGLQHIYSNPKLQDEVFDILKRIIPENIDTENGRPGMALWTILVLGMIRVCCNIDFDKLKDLADYHSKIREMIGHGLFDKSSYSLQTLKDNISLFTPEILDKINQQVVHAGHKLVKPSKKKEIFGKCDSFVVETNVHFPTDVNLLFDGVRKAITLCAQLCLLLGISGWRQYHHNIKQIKKCFRRIQKLKRSTSQNKEKKAKREQEIRQAYESYLEIAEAFIDRVKNSLLKISQQHGDVTKAQRDTIMTFIRHSERQVDQIRRRALKGETIPHDEKVFSLFQEHTEWISKGKAGVSQELGLRVCVMTDQYGFILHHLVMEKITDDLAAVPITRETKERFPDFFGCSYDKGFYSPANRESLANLLDKVILPKKGKLSKKDKDHEYSEEFIDLRHKHSAVESAINAVENHGLDRCLDHGITGFKRYVALAVTARNLQILGHHIQQQQLQQLQKSQRVVNL